MLGKGEGSPSTEAVCPGSVQVSVRVYVQGQVEMEEEGITRAEVRSQIRRKEGMKGKVTV